MIKQYLVAITLIGFSIQPSLFAQKTWFIDGYHGGAYGHYPKLYTSFINTQLQQHPNWYINVELEPETWDSVKVWEPEAYATFAQWFADTASKRIEYVSPAYGQSYLFNISGESIIRQFSYGMKKIRQHFPNAQFTTYSSEEPCFTSCLPGILSSFGYRYASLKNPNTCWGGYTRAYGGETVNWIGPDGSKLITVPRYATEELVKNSTWQTDAWTNSVKYYSAALAYGVQHPVAMCLQDAGWRNGPWLGRNDKGTVYTTWRNYFENIAAPTTQDWRFSQEDVLVGLVWGSQELQRTAQKVRRAESRLIQAEKMASLAGIYQQYKWPDAAVDEAWRTLLLSQHHDCWIVPLSWVSRVNKWMANTDKLTDSLFSYSLTAMQKGSSNTDITVYNTAGVRRKELVSVVLPDEVNSEQISVQNSSNQLSSSFIKKNDSTGKNELCFVANVPAAGYASYKLINQPAKMGMGAKATTSSNGEVALETDVYKLVIAKNGLVKSLFAKALNKEFVSNSGNRKFNEMKGFFYDENRMVSGQDEAVSVVIKQNNPLQVSAAISGKVGVHPFTQNITLTQGQRRIDFEVRIDWQKAEGIGDAYAQKSGYDAKDYHKAFYVDTAKLSVSFPVQLANQKVYKDAPFDVTESKLGNTFYRTWDSIKNVVIYRWVDIVDTASGYGLALLSDHTTSYSHSKDFPLSLTLAYSGSALWSGGYRLRGTTSVKYALIPHKGTWDNANLNEEATNWNEPLLAAFGKPANSTGKSLLDLSGTGYELSSLQFAGDTLTARFYNASGTGKPELLKLNGTYTTANWVELNGQQKAPAVRKGTAIEAAMPRFGFRTLQIVGFKAN